MWFILYAMLQKAKPPNPPLKLGTKCLMRLRRKQICADCHFFVREERTIHPVVTLEIETRERQSARNGDFSWLHQNSTLCCSLGVWDEGHNFNRANRGQVIAQINRRNFCFWWKHHPAMLLPAAKVLQEREAKNRDASRDRRLTIYGLWIAAIALAINAYLMIAEKHKLWPFN